jgi:hypothetical protein
MTLITFTTLTTVCAAIPLSILGMTAWDWIRCRRACSDSAIFDECCKSCRNQEGMRN